MIYNRALVTGATSGLGKALSQLLAAKGIPLLITGRDLSRLEALASALPVSTICYAADLSRKEERQGLIEQIHRHVPDLIINNAGFGLYGAALRHATREQLDILEINANALLEISLESARILIAHQKRGTIVNISSAAAFFPYPTFSVYAATKAFVLHFSESFDREVAPFGLRVLCACPGQIATDFRNRAAKHHPQSRDRRTLSVEKAAQCIWRQIEKEQAIYIFDWRYRLLVSLGKLLPRRWVQARLQQEIAFRCGRDI